MILATVNDDLKSNIYILSAIFLNFSFHVSKTNLNISGFGCFDTDAGDQELFLYVMEAM